MTAVESIAMVVVAYLLGSIPFAIVIGKWFWHVDVRDHGSGNVGTTNVFRVLGRKAGTLVLIGDMSKGFIPVALARYAFHLPAWVTLIVAFAALVGHMYSVFLRGGGGKGVATGAGVVLGLTPPVFVAALCVFLLTLLTTRIVSLASIFAALTFAICTTAFGYPISFIILAWVATIIVIFAHRGNIRRMALRCEPRVTFPWSRSGSRPDGSAGGQGDRGAA